MMRLFELSPAREQSRLVVRSSDGNVPFDIRSMRIEPWIIRPDEGAGTIRIRANLKDYRPLARVPARDLAARLPTLVLLEELVARLGRDDVIVLTDAMLSQGHRLATILAELPRLTRRRAEDPDA